MQCRVPQSEYATRFRALGIASCRIKPFQIERNFADITIDSKLIRKQEMVPETGVEPATNGLGNRCSIH